MRAPIKQINLFTVTVLNPCNELTDHGNVICIDGFEKCFNDCMNNADPASSFMNILMNVYDDLVTRAPLRLSSGFMKSTEFELINNQQIQF